MAVKYTRTDLEFILEQILMAENGQPPVNPHLAFGLREVAGTNNNTVPGNGTFGAADQTFPQMTDPLLRTVTYNVDGTAFDPNPLIDGDTITTSYIQTAANPSINPFLDPIGAGWVIDPDPRMISNLIVDQTASNPAAVQAQIDALAQLGTGYLSQFNPSTPTDVASDGSLFIPNITPDAGLSAPANNWFTFFGQFFDHGLDLISNGGNGTVFIPLAPDDPLITRGPDGIAGTGDEVTDPSKQFMVLTRATDVVILPGKDGVLGTADDVHLNQNTTTPFVDQNQTYSSHPAHQVFLREYATLPDGTPYATGRLLSGADGGMATWADVKLNARKIGIILNDTADLVNIPLVKVDAYGNFIPAPNGLAQLVMNVGPDGKYGTADDTTVYGSIAAGVVNPILVPAAVVRIGHAFLNDIQHNADPVNPQTHLFLAPDGDNLVNDPNVPRPAGTFDNELLDKHYIAGDGRLNENIALTAVHDIFHSEHNRLVEHTKDMVRAELAKGDLSFAANWTKAGANLGDGIQDNEWNGERLFQAAKFGTETQYQHLVFEDFARKVAPTIHLFGNNNIHLDPAITAEFANVIYRFGHSMLDENVSRYIIHHGSPGDPLNGLPEMVNGRPVLNDIGLIEAFTNPLAFAARGADATGEIVLGSVGQISNAIDEFVTGALRNNLLGIPLDLAALNIARGRDTGAPPLNLVRNQFFNEAPTPGNDNPAFHDTTLKPYASWDEFGQFLKHPLSLVNFMAAYGTHQSILDATTAADKRAAAAVLYDHGKSGSPAFDQDAFDFLHSTGQYVNDVNNVHAVKALWSTGSVTGLDSVDLWVGGLAEKLSLFGGLLGSTFNYIFETQLEALQDGDRLYYLPRIEGIDFGTEIEANSFASLIQANTSAKHLPASIFLTPEYVVEAATVTADKATWLKNPDTGAFLVERLADGTVHFIGDDNFLGNTMVLGGTAGNDRLVAGHADDDTVWGDGGDDYIDGGNGNDFLYGGTGNDTIEDSGGNDVIHGDEGNDIIRAGIGDDIVFGGDGNDLIDGGAGIDEIQGGLGNDIMRGGEDDDALIGNAGDDWIEGGAGGDGLVGDQGAPTGQVPLIQGNDVLDGGSEGDKMQGFSGDDIMLGQGGFDKFLGGLGFDWGSFENETRGVDVDMTLRLFIPGQNLAGDAVRDIWTETEGFSGTRFDDTVKGENLSAVDPFNMLTNVSLINGLSGFFPLGPVGFSGGDILLGGDGNDTFTGGGGNDIIDGDRYLHVGLLQGYKPGSPIVREIRNISVAEAAGDIDRAVFSDSIFNYSIIDGNGDVRNAAEVSVELLTPDAQGFITIRHNPVGGGGGGGGGVAIVNDGTDKLRNIERLVFADGQVELNIQGNPALTEFGLWSNRLPAGGLTLQDNNNIAAPAVGDALTVRTTVNDLDGVLDANGVLVAGTNGFIGSQGADIPISNLHLQWQVQDLARPAWTNIANANSPAFLVTNFYFGRQLRVVATYTDGLGVVETVASAATPILLANPLTNAAPTILQQVASPGLPDTIATEDTEIVSMPIDLLSVFTDDHTPPNLLAYTATLANGQPLSSVGLQFNLIPDLVNGGISSASITGTPGPAGFAGPISVKVTATDIGNLSVTDTFIIEVQPVKDGAAPLTIAGTRTEGLQLTGALGADPDGAKSGIVYQWLRDKAPIIGANTTTYTLGNTDGGHKIELRASYTDAQGFDEVVITDAGPIAIADNGDAPLTILGNRVVGQSLRAALGTDPDAGNGLGPATFDWLRKVGAAAPVVVGTGDVYQLTNLDAGAGVTLSVVAHYTDGQAFVENVTATVDPVSFVNNGQAPITITGSAQVGRTLTANLGVDPDGGPTGTPQYQWLHAGTNIVGATGIAYVIGAGDLGTAISVRVSYTDAEGWNEVVTSAATAAVGANNAPTIAAFNTAPVAENTAGTVKQVVASDLDGNPLTYSLSGGDSALFNISSTGAVSFKAAPDFETPLDADHNNSYVFDVNVSDGIETTVRTMTINVTNVAGRTITGNNNANTINANVSAGVTATPTQGGATSEDDIINGRGGNDTMSGLAGNDTFLYAVNGTANDGADTIDGGTGVDTLNITGSVNSDALSLVFDGARISSVSGGTLTGIEVVNVALGAGTGDLLSYAGSTENVVVDLANGTGSGLSSISGVENVTGGAGNDNLKGNAGANVLSGGAGVDTLSGGLGNDTINGNGGDDIINYTVGDGADTVNGGVGTGDTLNITGTGGASTDSINVVVSLVAGVAQITQVAGGNVTNVELFNIDLLGNTTAGDTLSYAGSTTGVTVNFGTLTATGFASISGVENIIGTSRADSLTGDAGDNVFTPGLGNDVLDGGDGNDTVSFVDESINLFVNLATGQMRPGGAGNPVEDTMVSIENVIGGTGADTIIGSAVANVLNGGAGNAIDTITGGAGDDLMTGGGGADRYIFAAGFGNDTITDFDANPNGGQDRLDISALGINAANFAARVSIVVGQFDGLGGNDTRVTIDGTNSITLIGVDGVGNNVVTAGNADFLLAP